MGTIEKEGKKNWHESFITVLFPFICSSSFCFPFHDCRFCCHGGEGRAERKQKGWGKGKGALVK